MATETPQQEQQAKHRREASELSDLLSCEDCKHRVFEPYPKGGGVEWCNKAKGVMLPETCFFARETFCGEEAKLYEAR